MRHKKITSVFGLINTKAKIKCGHCSILINLHFNLHVYDICKHFECIPQKAERNNSLSIQVHPLGSRSTLNMDDFWQLSQPLMA